MPGNDSMTAQLGCRSPSYSSKSLLEPLVLTRPLRGPDKLLAVHPYLHRESLGVIKESGSSRRRGVQSKLAQIVVCLENIFTSPVLVLIADAEGNRYIIAILQPVR